MRRTFLATCLIAVAVVAGMWLWRSASGARTVVETRPRAQGEAPSSASTPEQGRSGSNQPMIQYREYQGDQLGVPIVFRYPIAWQLQQEQGTVERYQQVRVLGPRNREDTYRCYLTIRSSPLERDGGKFDTRDALVKHYTDHLFTGASIDGDRERQVAGVPARDLTVSYTIPPLYQHGLKAIEIPVKTRTVVLQLHDHLLELVYSADQREYAEYAEAFDELLAAFRVQ